MREVRDVIFSLHTGGKLYNNLDIYVAATQRMGPDFKKIRKGQPHEHTHKMISIMGR